MSGGAKRDLKRALKSLYQPAAHTVTVVDVPTMAFLMVDGEGDPNTAPAYQQAVEALFGVAYAVKFLLKREHRLDDVVMPLEGLWWTPDMRTFTTGDKRGWHWTMMIRQPDEVTDVLVARGLAQARRKQDTPALSQLRLEPFHEGLAAQIMHVGPFATEGPTVAQVHTFIAEQGYTLRGKHHEIYLSDPRRAAPEKMRTVIRQPFTRER